MLILPQYCWCFSDFEKFKELVINENYDIVALPDQVLAETENKEVLSIPHYSLVETRKNNGDGVAIYIKDSLKYKVIDLTAENPEEHLNFEQLLEKMKQNGECFMIHVISTLSSSLNNSFLLTKKLLVLSS